MLYYVHCGGDDLDTVGLGRGDAFAQSSHGGMGTLDWADTEAMVDEAIKQGIADPNRLAIAGHSQGGYLAAWACTQTDRFKAAVASACVSDWGSLVLGSDLPDMEVNRSISYLFEIFLILCPTVRPIWLAMRHGLLANHNTSGPAQSDMSRI